MTACCRLLSTSNEGAMAWAASRPCRPSSTPPTRSPSSRPCAPSARRCAVEERSSFKASSALRLATRAATPSPMASPTRAATTARTAQRHFTLERIQSGATARRCTTASLAMPVAVASSGSSSQILSWNASHSWADAASAGSCSAPAMLIGMTAPFGFRRRYSSTSRRTQRGSFSVPRLATTTRARERFSALTRVLSSTPPGGASSSLKNTLKSSSRRRRARSAA